VIWSWPIKKPVKLSHKAADAGWNPNINFNLMEILNLFIFSFMKQQLNTFQIYVSQRK
jgi:hypothetical protein